MTYSVLSFSGSFRGSETFKLDWQQLLKYIGKGDVKQKGRAKKRRKVLLDDSIPHIIIPLQGRFKGEKGERCHLIPRLTCVNTARHERNIYRYINIYCYIDIYRYIYIYI